MSSSRRKRKQQVKSEMIRREDSTYSILSEFVTIMEKSPPPPILPKKAKAVSKFKFPYKTEEDKAKKISHNRKNIAVRVNRNIEDGFFHSKRFKPVSIFSDEASGAEGEAVEGAWAKFLAPENVPTTRLVWDDKTLEIIGIISKNIVGLKTNYEDPLKEKDTIVSFNVENMIQTAIDEQKKSLSQALDTLLAIVKERIASQSSYIPGINFIKGVYNRTSYVDETGLKILDFLQPLKDQHPDVKFSGPKLRQLLEHLRMRYKYITNKLNDNNHKIELDVLKKTLDIADFLQKLIQQTTVPMSAVPYLIMLDNKARHDKENLDAGDPERKITIQNKDKAYSITAKSLKNFRIIKRLIIGLAVRYLIQDTDGHNQNMSKDGWIYDFDMAKLRLFFDLRENNFWDRRLREPDDTTFVVTAEDILTFPFLTYAKFYYWPANSLLYYWGENATTLLNSILPNASAIYKNPKNLFTEEDNKNYKSLANIPIAQYFGFQEFLKYALCDEKMYENIAKLHMRTYATIIDKKDGQKKNLLQEMVRDEGERIKKVREVLKHLPIFHDFLQKYGEAMLATIKQEIKTERDKYSEKIRRMQEKKVNKYGEKPDIFPYQRLVSSLNLDLIEERYREIFTESVKYKDKGSSATFSKKM